MSSLSVAPPYEALLRLLERLDEHHITYGLAYVRPGAIMVQLVIPGERWEVEFFSDGTVEVERFRSDGTIFDESALDELWHLDEERS